MTDTAKSQRAKRDDDEPVPLAGLLIAGLILGLLGDLLLRNQGAPGLGLSAWTAAIAAAALALHWWAGLKLTRSRGVWLLIAVALAAGLAWRGAPPLKLLAMSGTALAFGLAAYRLGGAWIRRARLFDYAGAFVAGAVYAWTGAGRVLADTGRWARHSNTREGSGWRRLVGVVRGLVIATPFLLVFGALFVSADAAFAALVRDLVHIDFELLTSHIVLFAACAWLGTGYLRGLSTGTAVPLDVLPRRPTLGITEVTTALTVINLLFLAFVVVQFRYLFAGDALVQLTADLTYAEYARRGFFELVAAATLVLPLLLAGDWLLTRERRRDDQLFRLLSGVTIALVLAVAASALQRLRLYLTGYGLTESRFYAAVLLFWTVVLLIWFAVTVLRGRRDAFAFGGLVAAYATIALLFVANPDAIIVRTNIARATGGATDTAPFDAAYVRSLSADAAPTLINALPLLPGDDQCRLARHLLERWGARGESQLRSWNWSIARARRAVHEQEPRLRALAGTGQRCL